LLMVLPILLFSACGNYEWNVTSSLCIRHCGIKVNCTYSVIKDSITVVQKKKIPTLLHTSGR